MTNGLASSDGRHQARASTTTSVNGDEAQHHRQTPPPASHISLDSNLTGVRRSAELGRFLYPRDHSIVPQNQPVTSKGAGTAHPSQGHPVETGEVQLPHRVQPDAGEVLLYIGSVFIDDESLIRCLVQGARRRLSMEARRGESAGNVGQNENRRRRHT